MSWLLLVYKVPREPTANRVYVWRKLKQLRAVAAQDAVWVLPATPRTQEQFQWLATEIVELGGESSVFKSQLVFGSSDMSLREQFEAPLRSEYEQILASLKKRKPDLTALSKKYQQTMDHDHFKCELGEQVRKKLLSASRGGS